MVLQIEYDAALDAVLDEVHERAREPAPVRQAARALARAPADDPELGERGGVVGEAVDELEQHGRGRVQEGVQERLLLALVRAGDVRVGRVLREDGCERREPVEEDQAFSTPTVNGAGIGRRMGAAQTLLGRSRQWLR